MVDGEERGGVGGVARRGDAEDDLDVCPPKLFLIKDQIILSKTLFL
jgi:hypothetical protein